MHVTASESDSMWVLYQCAAAAKIVLAHDCTLTGDVRPIWYDALPRISELSTAFLHVQPKQKGKRQAAAAKPSDKDLQLAGLLYIMYLLANDEVRGT